MNESQRAAFLLFARILVLFLFAYMLAYRLTIVPDSVKLMLPIWPLTQYLGETMACVLIAPLFGKAVGLGVGVFTMFLTNMGVTQYMGSLDWTYYLTASPMALLVFFGVMAVMVMEARQGLPVFSLGSLGQRRLAHAGAGDEGHMLLTDRPQDEIADTMGSGDDPLATDEDHDDWYGEVDGAAPAIANDPVLAEGIARPKAELFPGQIIGLDSIAGMSVVYEGSRGQAGPSGAPAEAMAADLATQTATPADAPVESTEMVEARVENREAEMVSAHDLLDDATLVPAVNQPDQADQVAQADQAVLAAHDQAVLADREDREDRDLTQMIAVIDEEPYAFFDEPFCYAPPIALDELIAAFDQELGAKGIKVTYLQGTDPRALVDESVVDVLANAIGRAPEQSSIDIQILDADGMQTLMITNPISGQTDIADTQHRLAAMRSTVNRAGGQLVMFTLYDELTAIMQRPHDELAAA